MEATKRCLIMVLAVVGFNSPAFAAQDTPQTFTFDGRAYANAAGTAPLLDVISTKIQILNPAQDCILYEETQSVTTTTTNGYFTIQVGSATGAAKRSANDSANAMSTVFSNVQAAINGKLLSNGAGCVYNPASGDKRYVRVQMTPAGDGTTRTFSPNMALDSVPSALVAERAESVQGLAPANILQVNGTTASLTQANAENIFSTTNYPRLTTLLSVPPANYVQTGANGSAAIPSVAGNPGAGLAAGQIWYDSTAGLLKYYDGAVKTVGTSGGSVTSITASTGLTGGTITTSGTIAVDVGTTVGKIVQVQTGGKLPVLDGSNLTNVVNSLADGKIFVGNAGGVATAQSPGGDLSMDNAGAFAVNKIKATPVSATPTQSGHVLKYDGTTNYTPGFIGVTDIRSTVAGNAQFFPTNCTASQALTWVAPSDIMACTAIVVSGSNFANQTANTFFSGPSSGGASAPTFRAIAAGDLPTTVVLNGGNTVAAAMSVGSAAGSSQALNLVTNGSNRLTVDTAGNVGINTIAPAVALEVSDPVAETTLRISTVGTNEPKLQFYSAAGAAAERNWQISTAKYAYGDFVIATSSAVGGNPQTGPARLVIGPTGNVGFGPTGPTGVLHLKAGTAAASSAPLKFSSGTNLTTPEAGAVEYDGTSLYYTDGTATRKTLATTTSLGSYLPLVGGTLTGDVTMTTGGAVIKNLGAGQTLGVYGGTTATEGALKLGSGGGTLYGKSGYIGINRTNPAQALDVYGPIRSDWDLDVEPYAAQLELRRTNSGVFDGSGMTIDIGMGQGLTNLVAGATVKPAGGGYQYLGTRGASRIKLNDGTVELMTGDTSAAAAGDPVTFLTGLTLNSSGMVGIGVATGSSSAALHIKAGTAAVNTAPLKFTAGTNMTTPEAGAVEYDGTNLFYTDGTATRRTLATTSLVSTYLPLAGGTMTGDVTMTTGGAVIKNLGAGQTLGVYGGTTATEGALKLGSGGGTLYGKSGAIGIGTTNPEAPLTVYTSTGYGLLLDSGLTQQESPAIAFKGWSSGAGVGGGGRLSYDSDNGRFDMTGGSLFLDTGSALGWPGWAQNNISSPSMGNGTLHFNTTLKLETKSDNTGITSVPYGTFGVGTTAPSTLMHVKTTTAGATVATFENGTGNCTINPNGGGGGLSCSSDVRLKENIETIPDALKKVLDLRGVTYQWKKRDPADQSRSLGFIAQEAEQVVPELVSTDMNGYKKVNYANFVSVIVEAMKDFFKQFKGLEDRVDQQDSAIAAIEKENAVLKQENQQLKDAICELNPKAKICLQK